jgi:hypothetical protein
MRPTVLARAAAAGLILAAAAAGCAERRGYAPVSGQIRLDGKPLAGAGVAFEPVAPAGAFDAEGVGSFATNDAQGRVKLYGV